LTSRELEPQVWSNPNGWEDLRHSGALGFALWETGRPRIVTVDANLCAVLGRAADSLDGLTANDLEHNHPFAWSVEAWRRHLRTVQTFDRVEWPTWLVPASGPAVSAVFRLKLVQLDASDYLLGELLEVSRGGRGGEGEPQRVSLDDLPCAACRVGSDGAVLASNARATSFLECQFDARQKRYRRTLPGQLLSSEREALDAAGAPWWRALRDGVASPSATLGSKRADGTLAWFLVSAAPEAAADPSGQHTATGCAVVTCVDVTATKEASDALSDADRRLRRTISSVTNLQDQLARSEHMASLGLMAAGVAHEINNPLSYILSNLSFAAERAIDHESRLALREALEGAGRVRDIVRDLKTLSRMESEEDLKAVDVRNAVDAALKLSFDDVRHRARVQRHFSEVPRVLGNETRLVQVMLNLVTNAAQSIAPGSPDDNQITVEVKLAETEGEVEILVSDTGIGISEAHLPKVFEPFFTTKPAGEGTGLGLSICHRLIHAMGGRIQVTSEEGRGSRFSVFLSIAPTSVAEDAVHTELALGASRRLRLLIVDDEVLVARAVRRVFDKEFRVEIALDGESALEKLRRADYDVVLCDVMMPGISGLDVYRQVRSENEPLARRFVFATGGLFSQELSDSVKRLSNMIVEKPFDPAELRRVILAAVPEPRSEASPHGTKRI
jgi:signal transduction histidine kinase/ActR/RegA family two-component response regulator